MEIAYLGLVLLALPAAFLENAFGLGGTLWAFAWKKQQSLGGNLGNPDPRR
jgi:hypothetical protein